MTVGGNSIAEWESGRIRHGMVRVRVLVSVRKYILFVCPNMDEVRVDDDADPEQPESETAEAHYVWLYLTITNNNAARKGWCFI